MFLYLFCCCFILLQDLKKVNSYLKSCFLIFPNYNLGHGLMEMAYNEYINEYYAKIGTVTIKLFTLCYVEASSNINGLHAVLRMKSPEIIRDLSGTVLSGQFDKMKSPFEWDIVTRGLVAMTVEGVVGFLITILCQYNFLRKPS